MTLKPANLATLPPAQGLPNLGATCWLNALTQAMCTCESVRTWAQEAAARPGAAALVRAFAALPAASTGAKQKEDSSAAMVAFVRELRAALHAQGRRFRAGGNECAGEGLVWLCDALDRGLPWQDHVSQRVMHRVTERAECSCGATGTVTNTEQLHYVVTGRVDDILDSENDTDWRCPECQKNPEQPLGVAVHRSQLSRVREVLVVLFPKYLRKRDTPVPPRLRVRRARGGAFVYGAVAAVDHFGGMSGGHYTARCLRRVDTGGGAQVAEYDLNDSSARLMGAAHSVGEASETAPAISGRPSTHLVFYELLAAQD